MKRLEELAQEYADKNAGGECSDDEPGIIRAFEAGYQAAKGSNTLEKSDSWISVKDRLPEVEQYVVIFWNDMFQISYLTVWEHFAIGASGIVPEPTHWMPLPKPPTE